MSDERPEPVLQPMKIIQAPETPEFKPPTDSEGNPIPLDRKGKKLVMSKKEYEAAKAAKPKAPILIASDAVIAANREVISNLDRNAKVTSNDNQAPEFDQEWLKEVGGKPVSVAWLQTGVSVSGYVSSETTFSPQKIKGLTMSWGVDGLLCKIDNKRIASITLLIPAANVKILALE